jgi:hypothetical protein
MTGKCCNLESHAKIFDLESSPQNESGLVAFFINLALQGLSCQCRHQFRTLDSWENELSEILSNNDTHLRNEYNSLLSSWVLVSGQEWSNSNIYLDITFQCSTIFIINYLIGGTSFCLHFHHWIVNIPEVTQEIGYLTIEN